MSAERPWHLTAYLTCGHEIDFGAVGEGEIETLIPRRSDGSFGALRCPHGRRRVTLTRSSTTRDPDARLVQAANPRGETHGTREP